MNKPLKGYLQLCRPANLPTAAADILAGLALAGFFVQDRSLLPVGAEIVQPLLLLVFSSVLLYAGGVVLNDVFDAKLDAVERPERPIPSGIVKLRNARLFGFLLLLLGVILAFLVGQTSGLIAAILAIAILAYDAYSKHFKVLGPLNMGICRGLNLLLGISVFQSFPNWCYVFIPVVYIAAITMISQSEVHGENKKNIIVAGLLYVIVIFFVTYLHENHMADIIHYAPFLVLFALAVFIPLVKAYRHNVPGNIKNAVKAGVISIVILDAAIAVGHSNWTIGLLLLLLLPLSILLSKVFAVT